MTVFSSLQVAHKFGFEPLEWDQRECLWVVRATVTRGHCKCFILALAREEEETGRLRTKDAANALAGTSS